MRPTGSCENWPIANNGGVVAALVQVGESECRTTVFVANETLYQLSYDPNQWMAP